MNGCGTVVIRPENRFVSGVALVLFFGIWVGSPLSQAHGIEIVAAETSGAPLALFLAVILWAAFGVIILWASIWMLFGSEIIAIDADQMAIMKKIGPMQFGRRELFTLAFVERMRLEERTVKSKGHTFMRHKVTFDYKGLRKQLFIDISKEKGELLLNGPLRKLTAKGAGAVAAGGVGGSHTYDG